MAATIFPGSNTVFAWNNYVLTSSLSASSQALPVTNLQDEQGDASTAWQTASGVTQGATITITPPIQQSTWRVFGLFRTNLTAFATVTVTLYNNPSVIVWSGGADGPEPRYYQSIVVAPQDTLADYCTIQVDDAGNPDGFLNIPLVYAGDAWFPQTAPAYDTTFGGDFVTNEQVSRGGQEYPELLWERRRSEVSLAGVRAGEVNNQLADMAHTARRGNNILFIPDITSETMTIEAIYGRVTATADVGYPYGAADRRSWRGRFTERL